MIFVGVRCYSPEAEQKQINDEIDQRLSILQGLEKQVEDDIKRLERTRQSILSTAFSGFFNS